MTLAFCTISVLIGCMLIQLAFILHLRAKVDCCQMLIDSKQDRIDRERRWIRDLNNQIEGHRDTIAEMRRESSRIHDKVGSAMAELASYLQIDIDDYIDDDDEDDE